MSVNPFGVDDIEKAALPVGPAVGTALAGTAGIMHAKNVQATKDGKPPSLGRKLLTGGALLGAGVALKAVRKSDDVSAFGVDHVGVEKAHAFTERGRRKKAEDAELRSTLSRSEARKANLTDGGYTVRQAPKGKKLQALGTYTVHSRSRHGTKAGAHAKAKQKYGS